MYIVLHDTIINVSDRMLKLHPQPKRFREKIDRYIESNDNGRGDDYWPIVKKVSLRIPNCDVLSSGVTLIDLPGTGDSNSARDKIAKDVCNVQLFINLHQHKHNECVLPI